MSREIKFRAWDMVQKYYFPVDTIAFLAGGIKVNGPGYGEGWVSKNNGFENKIAVTVILEQFTGLYDKKRTKEFPKGQEIYEGDIIVLTPPAVGKGQRYEIFWKKERARFGTKIINAGVRHDFTEILSEYVINYGIIGNIHTNPELLEKSE